MLGLILELLKAIEVDRSKRQENKKKSGWEEIIRWEKLLGDWVKFRQNELEVGKNKFSNIAYWAQQDSVEINN